MGEEIGRKVYRKEKGFKDIDFKWECFYVMGKDGFVYFIEVFYWEVIYCFLNLVKYWNFLIFYYNRDFLFIGNLNLVGLVFSFICVIGDVGVIWEL